MDLQAFAKLRAALTLSLLPLGEDGSKSWMRDTVFGSTDQASCPHPKLLCNSDLSLRER